MRELFDKHQERMTPAEDRRVWSAMRAAVAAPERNRPGWRVLSGATLAAAAVVAVAVVQMGGIGNGPMSELARNAPGVDANPGLVAEATGG